jgi:CHAT domain-containing protein/tetratricopeptide (TPR) repeat protein
VILLTAIAWVLFGPQQTSTDLVLGEAGFRREFEAAFGVDDLDRIEALVLANPTLFVGLFQSYARVWIEVAVEPQAKELLALEHARMLAEAVDSALAAPGLLKQWERLDGYGERDRSQWREAHALVQRDVAGLDREYETPLVQAAQQFETLGDAIEAGRTWFQAGEFLRIRRQPGSALDCFRRSLEQREPLGSPQDSAASLSYAGLCYEELGLYEKALQHHQRALARVEPLGNVQNINSCLNNLGNCYHALGQLEKAIQHHQRSLELKELRGNPEDIAASLNNLGACFENLGQIEKAIDHHRRALALREPLGNPHNIASSFNNLGNCYRILNQLDKAIDHHQRALELRGPLSNPQHTAASLDNLGSCYLKLGQLEEALDHLQRGLTLRESLGNPQRVAASLNNLGLCYMTLDQFEKAIEHHQRSLALKETTGNPLPIAASLDNLSICYQSLGRPAEALACLRRCFEALASVSMRSLSARDHSQFRSQYRSRHWRALDSGLQLARSFPALADAFWITESLRSRSMLGELAARAENVLTESTVDSDGSSLAVRRQQILFALETTRVQLEKGQETPGTDLEALQTHLVRLDQELNEVTAKLRRSNPRLMELALPEPAGVEEIRASVLSARQGLLQFVLAEDQSYLWLLTQEELSLHPLAGETKLRELYLELSRALTPEKSNNATFVGPARELYQALLGPLAQSLESLDELIIVADSFLGYLPFEALITDQGDETGPIDLTALPYLLQEKTITYAPSASFLVLHAKEGRKSEGWKKDALLFGDPVYAEERDAMSASATRAIRSARSFDRLQRTREEVTAVASELIEDEETHLFLDLRNLQREKLRSGSVSGSRFDLYLGNEVNESRLKSDLTGYRIVHLATHGYFDPEYPWFSGLVLSSTEGAAEGADFLNLIELGTLKLNAQLVFLSACETGKGELLSSEGVQSTARSFLIAGAQSVVATQWSVRDEVASTLARTFYRRLFDGEAPAAALRQAKLSIIHEGERGATLADPDDGEGGPIHLHAHPAFWAPFVLYGGSTARASEN